MAEDEELTDTDWRTLCDTLRGKAIRSAIDEPGAALAAQGTPVSEWAVIRPAPAT